MSFDVLLQHKPGEVRQVTSAANEMVKALRSLRMKKVREESQLFIAEGARTLIEALELKCQPLAIAYLSDMQNEKSLRQIIGAAKLSGALCLEVSQQVLDKISERDNPQTVIGVFRQRWCDLSAFDAAVSQVLVLEDVRDPGNLGTIMRTCDGFGIHHLVLTGQCTDPYGIEAVRASMGSIFSMNIAKDSRDAVIDWCRSFKGEIIGTSLEGASPIETANWSRPHAVVMGNEQKGLSDEMKGVCTQLVKIPMRGRADSFNLAVATGITLYLAASAE